MKVFFTLLIRVSTPSAKPATSFRGKNTSATFHGRNAVLPCQHPYLLERKNNTTLSRYNPNVGWANSKLWPASGKALSTEQSGKEPPRMRGAHFSERRSNPPAPGRRCNYLESRATWQRQSFVAPCCDCCLGYACPTLDLWHRSK